MTSEFSDLSLVFYCGSTLLEGPIWDAEREEIFCVSIDQGQIYRINPLEGSVRSYKTDGPVGCVGLAGNNMISAEKSGLYQIDIENGSRTFLMQPEQDPEMRFNDGKFDPAGRFLFGTKAVTTDKPGAARLLSYDGASVTEVLTGLTLANGLAFSPAGNTMYFIDTVTRKVGAYAYDVQTGEAKFESYILEFRPPSYPDGMCVDSDGNIWVAEWGGGAVRKWDPRSGNLLESIHLPVPLVTSCSIGGKEEDQLFITTARCGNQGGGLYKKPLYL